MFLFTYLYRHRLEFLLSLQVRFAYILFCFIYFVSFCFILFWCQRVLKIIPLVLNNNDVDNNILTKAMQSINDTGRI